MVKLRPISDWEKPLSSVGAVKGSIGLKEKMGRCRRIGGPDSKINRVARAVETKYGLNKNPFGQLVGR